MGNAELRANGKTRRTTVFGEGRDFANAFTMKVQSGSFWPDTDNEQARALVVLGAKVGQDSLPVKIRWAVICASEASAFA